MLIETMNRAGGGILVRSSTIDWYDLRLRHFRPDGNGTSIAFLTLCTGRNRPCDGRGDMGVSAEGTAPEAEKAAPRQSEEVFQTIFSQAAVPIAQIDLDGKILRL